MEINNCDKCNLEDDTTELIWIDAEGFTPLKEDNFSLSKYRKAIKKRYSALCLKCYKEECCEEVIKGFEISK